MAIDAGERFLQIKQISKFNHQRSVPDTDWQTLNHATFIVYHKKVAARFMNKVKPNIEIHLIGFAIPLNEAHKG